ncbi:unnamed protein product [Owenia fusiformis]|uniref:Uncharacterized protein n=1 Tax=Owenia fusiformis TaxID=6347 RepID=A0A8J1Y110_OWEFU|nr:unnamed protein product [Owenia fusiformis]
MMDDDRYDPDDRRIITLAAEVAGAGDVRIPGLLLQLKEYLDATPSGSKQIKQLKNDIWSYDLLPVLILVLKQDYTKVAQGWNTAAQLSKVVSQCCVGIEPSGESDFYDKLLPDAIENMLILAWRIQEKYIETSVATKRSKEQMLDDFKLVADSLRYLFSGHTSLTVNALSSPWLLQLLLTDDVETAVVVISIIISVVRVNLLAPVTVDNKVLHNILDELIYKLSASMDESVGSASTKCLLTLCDAQATMIEILCSRYKGLRPLLSKWTGKGFGRDLRQLLLLLDTGNKQKADMERLHRAACTIQAMFRSFKTRKKLNRADKAMGKLQKSFRAKREKAEKAREMRAMQQELQHLLLLRRKKAMRDLRNKQLEAIRILPAGQMDQYLEKEQQRAAIKIQAQFRGYRQRKSIGSPNARKRATKRLRSVIIIQRAVRKWLERLRVKRREPPPWQRPPGLTDDRRVELQAKILDWRENHPFPSKTRPQQEELHNKVQDAIRSHISQCKTIRKLEQRREALLARLETDADLLLNAPSLVDASDKDIELYTSRSAPVAAKARQNHINEIKLLNQPWWRKLTDEYQDDISGVQDEEQIVF